MPAPKPMLTQNSELRAEHIFNWTLPAWVAKKSDGKAFNVCSQAGACVKFCYARNGTYNFPLVKAAHLRNLERVQDDLNGWMVEMLDELSRKKFRANGKSRLPKLSREHLSPTVAKLLDDGAGVVRVHDAGDFFDETYLLAWLTIAQMTPDVLFYVYTKEVALFKRVVEPNAPANFLWCYSMGGKQDHLVDKSVDYHADVFTSQDQMDEAGYYNQEESDLLCVIAPSNKIGIPANNIPHYKKGMAGRTFGEIEISLKRHSKEPEFV